MLRRFVSLFVWSLLSAAVAESKPDFSGTWRLNEQHTLPTVTGPHDIVFQIKHQEPSFQYTASGITGYAQQFSESYAFQTDGKGTPSPRVHIRAHWEGETLVLHYHRGDAELATFTQRLSPDRRQMFREGRLKDGRTIRQVYDKQ